VFFDAPCSCCQYLLWRSCNAGDAQVGGLAPLHYSSGLQHKSSIAITQLLLSALADPDICAADDDSYINRFLVRLTFG